MFAASILLAETSGAFAQVSGSATEYQFDIPSQPLASSLKVYSITTGLELYYESSLVDRHRSPALRGSFSRDAALRRLLESTGLSIASFEPGTVTILSPAQPANGHDLAALKSKAAEFTPYFAVIQAGLRAAFCRVSAIQVDAAELIIRLWIAPTGAVARAEILSKTGSEERDRAYAAAIRTLAIGQAPPPAMPQPVTLMILPRTSPTAAECAQPRGSSPVRASTYE
ncbi:STN domain-containing protein [Bradyrhizobium cenepequi]|uniref:STN domain-containing protein n=1 Tax=Bradyrhizobium cenepequi TaxID=2821403 RepID=UPI001CE31335|nr:STN domain-containing protein [Bradyrhizobium cenepequi]MCA6112679.1 STN domain-containing protein [Bradyrhizobium cenepequi]